MEITRNFVGGAEGQEVLQNNFQQRLDFSKSSGYLNSSTISVSRMNLALALAGLLSLLVGPTLQLCDYAQEVIPGQKYYLYLPSDYTGEETCWWRAVAPQNFKIKLDCFNFSVPESPNCNRSGMTVFLSDDNSPSSRHVYCGYGSFSVTSVTNRMNINYYAQYDSQGSFTCQMTTDNYIPPKPPSSECDCGWKKQTRIVGGHETGVNEYPMMAGLVSFRERIVFCGATIIASQYALTAAHCFVIHSLDDSGLLVGDHDISTGNETNAAALYALDKLTVHPQYNTVSQWNDIALVKTKKFIKFSLEVGPACLPFRYNSVSFAGETVTALGWGSLEYAGPTSNTLQEVDLTVLTPTACNQAYNFTLTNNQMCTYAKNKDACQSDSGGPVLWENKDKDRVFLCGIISYGIHCANKYPGVNTRVTSYLMSFILDNTADATFCVR